MTHIASVGVVGLGTMGAGIVEVFARGGLRVVGVEMSPELAERGRGLLEKSTARAVEKGKLDEAGRAGILDAVTFTADLADLAEVDLVVEAVPEKMAIKHDIFGKLDAATKPEAILATNTSSLSVTEIASGTQRRNRVVGMHFFNPAPVQKLVEVIHTPTTDDDAVAAVAELATRLGKEPVVVADRAGFVANHLLYGYMNRSGQLYFDGAVSAEDLDTAMHVGAGLPMGPLTLMDMVGLDVCNGIGGVIHSLTHKAMHAPSYELATMVNAGLLGRKSGAGFHPYSEEARAAAAQSADDAAAPARDVSVVGVIGAGDAAGELAEAFSGAGLEVLRIEEAGDDLSVLSRAQVVVEAAELVEPTEVDWDELDDEELEEDAALVELDALFLELGRVLEPDAVIVSLTADSTVDLAVTSGRHMASLRAVLHEATPYGRLIEFGRITTTAPEVEATVRALVQKAGLTPVVVRDQPGLVVEWLLVPFLNEAVLMAQSGYASSEDIDTAMVHGCGYPMGPFALLDHLGAAHVLDVQSELFGATQEPGLAPAASLVDHAVLDLPFGA
ncbi:3-hydroxyacyl-CoA dehydrogenase NAD-binding domain-containing protein [Kytococcus sedentarius]|uniref:3-hydroxyacyl-CoA dehydrogenase NAD-binding domain-containing protein n=1 Tax=Kytococcus sedentarius TaxID=1276 RepID=UPI003879A3D4